MAIPQEIKDLRPKNLNHATEVRSLNGRYYVYEITSVWDANTKKAKKKTLHCVGSISNNKFIPNKYYMMTYQNFNATYTTKNYGALAMFRQLGTDIEEKLEEFFPDIYRQLITISLLCLVYKTSGKEMRYNYLQSYLCNVYPDLALSADALQNFFNSFGARVDTMKAYMKSYVTPGTKLLFDGTSIFCSSKDSYLKPGYNKEHSLDPQYKLLYVFDKSNQQPIYYKLIPGSVPDTNSFKDVLNELQLKESIIIGDKGFASNVNINLLQEAGLNYILPLRDNTKKIPKEFEEELDLRKKFDGHFVYKKRLIWFKVIKQEKSSNWIYIFWDQFRAFEMDSNYVEKQEKHYEDVEEGFDGFFKNKRRGIISFVSNTKLEAQEVYLDYKERWHIENCFDYMKNNVTSKMGFKRSNEQIEALSFINHLATLYFYKLIRAIDNAGLKDKYTPDEVIQHGKNILKITDNHDNEKVSELSKEDVKLFSALGISL